jgi:hypothetical protein
VIATDRYPVERTAQAHCLSLNPGICSGPLQFEASPVVGPPLGSVPSLRRTWSEQPYGEKEITLLEEEVLPTIRECLVRVEELDQRLLAQHELLVLRCELEAKRHALA